MAYLTHNVALASGSFAATATASVNFANWYNLYSIIEVLVYGIIPATNSTSLLMRTSADGTTFDSAASNYAWVMGFLNTNATASLGAGQGAFSTGDTSITICGTLANTASVGTSSARIVIYNPSNASNYSSIESRVMGGNVTATGPAYLYGTSQRLAAQVTKGVQLLMSSGNITCTYRVFGYA